MSEEVVTFRVTKRLKERMGRLRHINWSELLRSYAEDMVSREENRIAIVRDPQRIERAIQEMDRLTKVARDSGWVGSEEVIKWRKRRYSYSTQASQ
ncbi:MAG: hypothetical protein ACRECH_17935 [Nitrososphaerales archaeon]